MATTFFNNNILNFFAKMQDSRTDPSAAGDTGHRYTSAMATLYQNNSVRALLLDKFQKYGDEAFETIFSDYIKTGSQLTLASGIVASPLDSFIVLELKNSAGTVKFRKLEQKLVQDVIMNTDGLIVPSLTSPIFYEEGGNIVTLGLTTGNVIPRYIRVHQDIAVSLASPGSGKKNSAGGSYVASTQTLSIAMTGNFVAGTDENKRIMIYDSNAAKVYYGRIASIPTTGSAILSGDNLPSANITGTNVSIALVSDNDITDLTLDPSWFDELINRMVAYAVQDAKNVT